MAYTFDEPKLGLLQIAQFDSGFVPPNQATAIPTPPAVLGMIARAKDPTFGEGEFICLAGVASTVIGSLVTYNQVGFITALCPSTANLAQPVAVAMSANILATTFGWYQIGGVAVVKKTAVKVNPNVAMFISGTAGRVFPTATTGKAILGARSANTATIASATSTINMILDRPHAQGQII